MSTEFFNDQWRIPSNENQNKVSNYSMDFDGSSDFISVNNSSESLNVDFISISAWYYPTSFVSSSAIISTPNRGIGYHSYSILLTSSGNLRVVLYTGANFDQTFTSAGTLNLNQWNFICMTYDGSNVTVTINTSSQSIARTGALQYTVNPTGNIEIGRRNGNSSFLINGNLDQVSIFDYGLSATEVSTLYGGGTAITNPMTLSPKPIAYYQLGDQSVDNGANYLVPNNSLSDYVFDFPVMNSTFNPDKIFLNNQAQVFNNATNFSFSGWFKINIDRNQNIFEIKDGSNYRFNINYYYFVEALRFNIDGWSNYADAQNLISDGKIAIGEWFHYAGVFNGSGATNADRTKLYINGQEQTLFYSGTQATSLGAIGATNTISLGNYQDNFFIQFGGQASNIQMWDASLSSPEVTTLYNNGSPYTGTQPQSSNLRFWYKLNAADTFNSSTSTWTIKDYAGSNDATSDRMTSANLVVSDLQQTSGYSPYALDFDGVNDYLDFNNASANIMTNKNAISISGWFKLDSNTTSAVFSNWYGGTAVQYLLRYNTVAATGVQWYIYSNSSSTIISTDYFPNVGDWVHVVGVKDPTTSGGQSRVYINGFEYTKNSTDLSVAIANNSRSDQVGVFNSASNLMNGSISNVAYWTDTALTQVQVTEIYNQGVPSNLNNFSGTAPDHWLQIGSNSSFNTNWTCLDEIGTNNAVSVNMTNNDIVDGPGYSASGLGTSSIDIKGDAPYSTANGLSENMDVLDRVTDVPS